MSGFGIFGRGEEPESGIGDGSLVGDEASGFEELFVVFRGDLFEHFGDVGGDGWSVGILFGECGHPCDGVDGFLGDLPVFE